MHVSASQERETRTGLYLVSQNKKSEKADGIIPPYVEEHGPFEDYAAKEAMGCAAATGYPTDSSIKII